jgi:predicted dehydrogenase
VTPFGQGTQIQLFGSDGVLIYDLQNDRIRGASRKRGASPGKIEDLPEVPIPAEKAGGWRVEAEFVEAIRTGSPIRLTDFATGVGYMEFTEAVALSAQQGEPIELPLLKDADESE